MNHGGKIIFIVDDKLPNLRVLSDMLKQQDYKVRGAPDGRTALKMIHAAPPDLILLDIRMPGMDGYEVCRQLKSDETTMEIPVIFISALGEHPDKVSAFDAGCVDYITKPFQVEEVLARVRTHLELRNMTVRLRQEIAERKKAENRLRKTNDELETRVIKRTSELVRANQDLRKSESLLRQAQKMEAIGALAGGIAHDFNNILWLIRGNAEIANVHDLPEGHPARHSLEQIIKASDRAASLVHQILSFSRQSEGEFVKTFIHPILKEVCKLLRASLPSTIRLSLELGANEAACLGDPIRIHQIVMNLCANSLHAMRKSGGDLTIRTKDFDSAGHKSPGCELKPGAYVELSVGDTGEGISNQVKDRIFDPYFSTKSPEEGTGLGLAVVNDIVGGLKGDIRVESEKGKGTRFTILIPKIMAKPKKDEKEGLKAIPRGRETILFVDDEPDMADIGKRMLESLGYEILPKTDSIEALEAFRREPDRYDMVITDMTMPDMTGDKLAREILKIRPEIPILLYTGFSERITREQAGDIGIRDLLIKPLAMNRFAEVVRRELDRGQVL